MKDSIFYLSFPHSRGSCCLTLTVLAVVGIIVVHGMLLQIRPLLPLLTVCCIGGISSVVSAFSSAQPVSCYPQVSAITWTTSLARGIKQSVCLSSRPSVIIPALPCQFGHDRKGYTHQLFNRNLNRYTKLYVKQQVLDEEDVNVDTNNLTTDDKQILSIKESINDVNYINNNEDVIVIGETNNEDDSTDIDNKTGIDKPATQPIEQSIPKEFLPILFLCFLVTFLSALDRVAMSIAILPMAQELGYTETMKGQISSAVSYGYGLAILPIGLAVSVVSPRILMICGVSLWSLATVGTPLMAQLCSSSVGSTTDGIGMLVAGETTSLLPLLLCRGVMGSAEAVVLPTMQRILANWVSADMKATSLAIIISGFQLGTVGAYLVSPLVLDLMSSPTDNAGWRGMFYVYGLAGLLWLVPWSFIAKDAKSGAPVEDDCKETLVNNHVEDDASLILSECSVDDQVVPAATKVKEMQNLLQSAPWGGFARSKGVWAMTFAHAAKNFELYNLLAWTPTFFSQQYGLNVRESALFSVLPSVCGMVGGLTAGTAADYILRIFVGNDEGDEAIRKRTQVRKLFQSIALLGPATCLYLLSNLPDVSTAQVLLGGAVGLQAFDAAGFGAATQEKAGERWAGLLYSLTR